MLTKRIIPCLDIKDGRTVKGTNFISLRDAGDPVELAIRYCEEGADELVFLDITATTEKRKTLAKLVREIATHINIPFTVGGGINSASDVSYLLEHGADKISINTAVVNDVMLVDELARNFGSQCIVVAIDARYRDNEWFVVTHGGRNPTTLGVVNWSKELYNRGAGEILLTSMENDGTKDGFAIDITRQVASTINIPVIGSGGAGSMEHFEELFTAGQADAGLAASIFHYKEIPIPALKVYLQDKGIPVRL